MESKQRWQDWAGVGLGMWLATAPFFMPYGPLDGPPAWNAYVVGAAVTLFSAWALWSDAKWQEAVNFALGVWLLFAPFALDFYLRLKAGATSEVIVGILLIADAFWALAARVSAPGEPANHDLPFA